MTFSLPDHQRALVAAAQNLASLTPETLRVRAERLASALILVALLHRGTKTLRGAIILCEAGYGEQALILGRALFEDMVDAHWVVSHRDEAVSRFNDASLLAKKLAEERVKPYRDFADDLLPEAGVEESLSEEDRERLSTLLKKHRPGSWTRMGLKRRIEEIKPMFGDGIDLQLLSMFADLGEGLASDFVHPSAPSIYGQLDLDRLRAGEGINFFVGTSERYVSQAALLCAWSFAHLLSTVYDDLELEGRTALDKAYVELMQLCSGGSAGL
jgi:hypothetical protein